MWKPCIISRSVLVRLRPFFKYTQSTVGRILTTSAVTDGLFKVIPIQQFEHRNLGVLSRTMTSNYPLGMSVKNILSEEVEVEQRS